MKAAEQSVGLRLSIAPKRCPCPAHAVGVRVMVEIPPPPAAEWGDALRGRQDGRRRGEGANGGGSRAAAQDVLLPGGVLHSAANAVSGRNLR